MALDMFLPSLGLSLSVRYSAYLRAILEINEIIKYCKCFISSQILWIHKIVYKLMLPEKIPSIYELIKFHDNKVSTIGKDSLSLTDDVGKTG